MHPACTAGFVKPREPIRTHTPSVFKTSDEDRSESPLVHPQWSASSSRHRSNHFFTLVACRVSPIDEEFNSPVIKTSICAKHRPTAMLYIRGFLTIRRKEKEDKAASFEVDGLNFGAFAFRKEASSFVFICTWCWRFMCSINPNIWQILKKLINGYNHLGKYIIILLIVPGKEFPPGLLSRGRRVVYTT